jgi:hypothetical protein
MSLDFQRIVFKKPIRHHGDFSDRLYLFKAIRIRFDPPVDPIGLIPRMFVAR